MTCSLSASTGVLGLQVCITMLAWKCSSLLPLALYRSLSREAGGNFPFVPGLEIVLLRYCFRRKSFLDAYTSLSPRQSKTKSQVCQEKLQPVFFKVLLGAEDIWTHSHHLLGVGIVRCYGMKVQNRILVGNFKHTKVELSHVPAFQL